MVSLATKKIVDVQVLRGLAIVMVLTVHLSLSATILGYFHSRLTDPFYSGVDLFFVISGYVVTCSLMRSGAGPISFMVRRMSRLWPPMLVFLLFSLVANEIVIHVAPPFAVQILGMPFGHFVAQSIQILSGTFINEAVHPGYTNAAMWSLSVEFQFYATVAVLCGLGLLCGLRDSAIFKLLGAAAVLIYVMSFINRIEFQVDAAPTFSLYPTSFSFDFMVAGVLLALLPERVTERFGRYGWRTSCALIVIPIIILALSNSPLDAAPKHNTQAGFGFIVCTLCFAALVGVAAKGRLHWPHRLQSVLLAIGERSYTIYLIHFPCMALAWLAIYKVNPIWAARPLIFGLLQAAMTILLLTPLTWAMYRWVEKPSENLGAFIIDGWRRRASETNQIISRVAD
jgi:peptidoglycan/LPS O-acetylase OafA/YrhL